MLSVENEDTQKCFKIDLRESKGIGEFALHFLLE